MPMKVIMMIIVIASLFFAWQGMNMHTQVGIEEATFHQLQSDYLIQNKAVRDNAATGSELNEDLVAIANYPSELLRLKLVGVGKILTGIFLLLLSILMALMAMPVRLARIIKGDI